MLLAIETAETACSAALIANGALVDERHEVVGRGHAERLIPMIAELLGDRRPETIAVDCGPGSFTGIRVGLAAARGLGLGWNIPVTGFSSMALLAASAFRHFSVERLAVVLAGGHGQLFVARYQRTPFAALGEAVSLAPAEAAALCGDCNMVVGSGAQMLAAAANAIPAEQLVLRASDLRYLDPVFRNLPPRPIYGRAPDAKPKA